MCLCVWVGRYIYIYIYIYILYTLLFSAAAFSPQFLVLYREWRRIEIIYDYFCSQTFVNGNWGWRSIGSVGAVRWNLNIYIYIYCVCVCVCRERERGGREGRGRGKEGNLCLPTYIICIILLKKNGKDWNIDLKIFWSETLKKGLFLKNLDVDVRIILKLVWNNKQGSVKWICLA